MATIAGERPVKYNYGALWFGFLGAPAAWTLEELGTAAITSHYCYPLGEPLSRPQFTGVWWADMIVLICAALMALAALATATRQWRVYRPVATDWRGEITESHSGLAARYLSFSGILFGIVFSVLIAYSIIALLIVPLCGYQ